MNRLINGYLGDLLKGISKYRNRFILAAMLFVLLLSSSYAYASQKPGQKDKNIADVIIKTFSNPQIKNKFNIPLPVAIQKDGADYKHSTDAGYMGSSQPEGLLKPQEKQALEALAKKNGTLNRYPEEYILNANYSKGYVIKRKDQKISVRPMNSNKYSKIVLQEGRAYYPNIQPQMDALYLPLPAGLEEMYVIWTDKGQRIVNEIECKTGKIEISRNGNLMISGMELSKPVIFDSKGKRIEGKYSISKRKDNAALVEILFDKKGLTYPVLIDPVWRNAISMSVERVLHSATLLPNGKVLVAGGFKNSAVSAPDYLNTCELYDPSNGTWAPTGNMINARAYHPAVLLPNGNVLISGGYSYNFVVPAYTASSEVYDYTSGTWSAIAGMKQARATHSLILLQNGKVLAVGGVNPSANYLTTCELYNPATNTWAYTDSLTTGRYMNSATLLSDGNVLVAGGTTEAGTYTTSCELYTTSTGQWGSAGALSVARGSHTATLLPNGKVLVSGGKNNSSNALATCQIYNPTPSPGSWSYTGNSMSGARRGHSAVLLPNGKVLVMGGINVQEIYVKSCEYYDPTANTWSGAGNMNSVRSMHKTVLLPNGKVLVAGGADSTVSSFVFTGLNSSELFDPTISSWGNTGNLISGIFDQTATLLPNGKVLVAGGTTRTTELYDPSSGAWAVTAGALGEQRYHHTATLLPSGKVLIAGGENGDFIGELRSCELYDPSSELWTPTGSMHDRRVSYTATLLPNGKVLAAGGFGGPLPNSSYILDTCELYNPSLGTWVTTDSLGTSRSFQAAALLPNGKVLVAGGHGTGAETSCELYNPSSGTWAATGPLGTARYAHTLTLLPNGKVLVAGGFNSSVRYLTSCELYNPSSGTWAGTGSMSLGRAYHPATLLPNGKVLVAGGYSGGTLTSCELYDPSSGVWIAAASLNLPRGSHTATLLPNGKVLVASDGWSGNSTSCELARFTEYNYTAFSNMQPSITSVGGSSNFPVSISRNVSYALAGTGFKGISESSNGSYHNSATNYPRVYLQFANSGGSFSSSTSDNLLDRSTTLYPMTATQWTSAGTSISFTTPSDLPQGYYLLSVQANAVPSNAKLVYYSTQTDPPPSAPTFNTMTAASTTQMNYAWTDNSNNELGFRILDHPLNTIERLAAANATSTSETGLTVNTEYSRKVQAYNASGAATSAALSRYTLIQTPAGCTFEAPTISSITVHDDNGFSRLNLDSSGIYFKNTTKNTNSGWIRTNTWASTGLLANTSYSFTITARNGDGIITATSAASSKYTSIETPTGVTFDAITVSSVRVHSKNAPSNLASGQSGVYFQNITKGTNSGTWLKTNTWTSSSLSPNTPYLFRVTIRNGDGVISGTAEQTVYTLTTAPAGGTFDAFTDTSIRVHCKTPVPPNLSLGLSGLYFQNDTAGTDSSSNHLPGFVYPAQVGPLTYIQTNTWTSAGLTPNNPYHFLITSRNGDGTIAIPTTDAGSQYTLIEAARSVTFEAPTASRLIIHSGNALTNLNVLSSGVSFEVTAPAPRSQSGWLRTNTWIKTGLLTNTQYTFRISSRNAVGTLSTTSGSYSKYTAIQPSASATFDSITVSSIRAHSRNVPTNIALGLSGYYFENVTTADDSNWVKTNTWNNNTGLSENSRYGFQITTRNGDATVAATSSPATYVYTAISAPVTATFDGISTIQMNVHSSREPVNLSSGLSGIYFQITLPLGAVSNNSWSKTNTWTKSDLSANTQYTYKMTARNGDGLITATSAAVSKYTLIEAVTSATFEGITTSQMTIHSGNAISNLSSGASGIIFENTTHAFESSGLIHTNTWTSTGLSPNIGYKFKILTYNGNGIATPVYEQTKYTLAATPDVLTVAGSYDATDGYHCDITLNPNGNPAGPLYTTLYAVTTDEGTTWLQSDGTSATIITWRASATGWKYKNLTGNTLYTFKAKAMNNVSTQTALSAAVSDTTPPIKVMGLATVSATATTETLSWNPVDTADRYEVSIGRDINGTDKGITSTTEAIITRTGLNPKTTYYCFVRAVSTANGTGEPSSIISFETDDGIPGTPESFSVTSGSTSTLNYYWVDASDNESGFRILDGTNAIKRLVVANATSTNETIGLLANTSYTRTIHAYNSYGAATWEPAVTRYTSIEAATAATFEPITISTLTIHASNEMSNLASGQSGISFETTTGPVAGNSGWIRTNTWTKSGLSANTNYSFNIRTRNGDGTLSTTLSGVSKYTSIETVTAASFETPTTSTITIHSLSQPTNLSLGSSGILFENTTKSFTQSGWLKTNVWTSTGLSANTPYIFKIVTMNGNGALTPVFILANARYTAISAPAGATYEGITTTSITIHASSEPVNLASGSSGIYFRNVSKSTANNWSKTNTWTSSLLSANTPYTFRLTTRNGDGVISATTKEVTKYTLAATPAVSSVLASFDAPNAYHCDVTINENGNPAGQVTDYAVTTNEGSSWLQSNGSASSSIYWAKTTSWMYKNLAGNTLYSFKVKARNVESTQTALSAAVSDTTPPARPTNPTQESATATTVTLSWDTMAGANRYEVGIGTDAAGVNKGIASTTEAAIVRSGLNASTTYHWFVRAVSTANGTGESSAILHCTTESGVPDAPWNYRVLSGSSSTLNHYWTDASDNETGFRILDGTNEATRVSVAAGATAASETGLSTNYQYSRKVQAYNTYGAETSDAVLRYTSIEAAAAATFEGITVSAMTVHSSNSPTRLVSGESGVYFQITSPVTTNSNWIKTNTWIKTGLATNTAYSIRITTRNGDGTLSTTLAGVSKYTLAASPTVETVAGSYDATDLYHCDIVVNDSGNPSGTYYAVSTDSGTNWLQSNGTKSTTVYWSTSEVGWKYRNLTANIPYSFKVKAKNGDNTQTALSTAVSDTTPPGQPTGATQESATATTVTLSWNPVTAANRYEVSIGTDAGGTGKGIASTTEASITRTGLSASTTYHWFVRAVSTANGTGEPSTIAHCTTESGVPDAPWNYRVLSGSSSTLNHYWTDASNNETGFRILDGTNEATRVSVAAGATAASETGLSTNYQYSRKLQVYNSYGAATSDAVLRYTSIEAAAAATFEGITVSAMTVHSSNSPTRLVSGESGVYFQITSPITANSGWIKTNTWIATGLASNTAYSINITTRNGDGTLSTTLAGVSKYTLAASPDVSTVVGSYDAINAYHFDVTIEAHGNPAATNYALTTDEGSSWIQRNGTASAAISWEASTTGWYYKNLAANTSYSFKVKAKNGVGTETALSVVVSDTTPPSQVTGLTVSGTTASSALLTWETAAGANRYEVSKGTNTAGTNLGITSTTEAALNKTGLSASRTYYWFVKAVSTANGTGQASSISNFTTDSGLPDAGGNYTVLSGSTSVLNYYWTDTSDNEIGFKILEGTNEAITRVLAAAGSTSTSESGLLTNLQYSRKLQAYNSYGAATTEPAVLRYTSIEAAALATYEGVTATAMTIHSSNSFTRLATGESGIYFQITSPITSNSGWIRTNTWNATGLASNTAYSVKITSRNGDATVSTTLDATKWTLAASPTIDTVTGSYDATNAYHCDIIINNNQNTAGTNYALTTDEGSSWLQRDGTTSATISWEASTTGWYYKNLSANTLYSFEIKAKNGEDVETTLSASLDATTPPAKPTGLSSSGVTEVFANLSWTGVTAANTYEVSMGTDAAGTNLGVTATTETVLAKSGLISYKTYYWSVRAVSTANGTGEPSDISTFTTASGVPTTPESFNAVPASPTQLDYSWVNVSGNEDGFRILDGDYASKVDVASGAVSTSEAGLSANRQYTRSIQIYNSYGNSISDPVLKYTSIEAVTGATYESVTASSMTMHSSMEPSNLADGNSGIYFYASDPVYSLIALSGWIKTNTMSASPLAENCPVRIQITTRNGDGAETSTFEATKYTLIQAASGATWEGITTSMMTVHSSSEPVRLSSGNSGIYFEIMSPVASNSGWTQTNTWTKSGLSANTPYSFSLTKRNGDGVITTTLDAGTKYTSIEAPSGATWEGVTTTSITIHSANEPGNLSSGLSGLLFENTKTGDNSGWIQTNTWTDTPLTSGTAYTYRITARNGDGVITDALNAGSQRTLGPVVWNGGGYTNNWSEAANWTSNAVPTSSDVVSFDATSSKNCGIDIPDASVFGITIGSGYLGNLSANASNINVADNWTLTGGTFTAGTSTVVMNATSTGKTITTGGQAFNNITFNGSGGGWSFTDSATVNGDLTMTLGTLSGTNDVTVSGGDVTGNGTINLTGGTFLLDGTGSFGGSTSWAFNNLTFGDGAGSATTTKTGSNAITASDVMTVAANQTLDAGSSTWTLSGTGTPFVKPGTFTPNASTVRYIGTGITTIAAATYYNLETSPSSEVSVEYTVSGAGDVSYNGNYVPSGTYNGRTAYTNGTRWLYNSYCAGPNANDWVMGADLQTVFAPFITPVAYFAGPVYSDVDTNILSSWESAYIGYPDPYSPPAPTVTGGTSAAYTFAGGAVVINGNYTNGDAVHAANTSADTNDPTISILGNMVMNAGSIFAASNTSSFTIGGSWANSGTFTAESGTVTFNDAARTSALSGDTTFYSLTCATVGKVFSFEAGRVTTAEGTLTLTGSAGNLIALRSSVAGTQWKLNPSGAKSLSYVDVKDSNNLNATKIDPANSTDSGNNTNWFSSNLLPPTDLTVEAASEAVLNYRWTNNSSAELGFRILDGTNGTTRVAVASGAASASETGLLANTQYTRKVQTYNNYGTATSEPAVLRYTSIEAATGVTWEGITTASITIHSTNEPSNLVTGESGVYFENTTLEVNSTWIKTNTWTNSSLSPSTPYNFKITTRNGEGTMNTTYDAGVKYTLAVTPTIETVAANYDPASGYNCAVTINENGNGGETLYAVTTDEGSSYLQGDGTAGTAVYWGGAVLWNYSNLAANTLYSFKVKARNGDLVETTLSSAESDRTPPGQPLNLRKSGLAETTALLLWDSVTAADNYEISSGTDPGGTNLGITSTTEPAVLLTGLNSTARYFWFVKAVSTANGTGEPSSIGHFSPIDPTPPTAPTGFTATAETTTSLAYVWTAVGSNEVGFNILDDADVIKKIVLAGVYATSESGLAPNTAYTRKVAAYNDSGSALSETVTRFTSIEASDGADWTTSATPSITATSIPIRSLQTPSNLAAGLSGILFANTTEATDSGWQSDNNGWTSSGLLENTQYNFTITTKNGDGIISATTDAGSKYTSILNYGATFEGISTSSITVHMSSEPANLSSGSSGLHFEITDPAAAISNSGWIQANTWTNSSLSPNTNYIFGLKAMNGDGNETNTVAAAKYTLAASPEIQTVTGSWDSTDAYHCNITVNANGNPDGTYYAVSPDNGTNWLQSNGTIGAINWAASATGWKYKDLIANTTHSFEVKAKNGDDVETALSATLDATTPPAKVTGLASTNVVTEEASLSWNSVAAADVYEVNIETDTSGTNLGITSTAEAALNKTGLTGDTKYYWFVKAVSTANGTGEPSEISNLTTLKGKPHAPQNFAAVSFSESGLNYTWTDASDNEDGFKILDGSEEKVLVAANATSTSESGLLTNTAYTRTVQAYNGQGGNTSESVTRYTSVEAPAGVTWGTTGEAYITLNASNTFTNVSSGDSGVRFDNVGIANSDWQKNNGGWTSEGLNPNTVYSFTITSRNGDAVIRSTLEAVTNRTLAAIPSAPTVAGSWDAANANNIQVTINANGNPAGTEYAVTFDGGTTWLQSNGTATSPDRYWSSTLTGWVLKDQPAVTSYTAQAIARNADNVETSYSPSASASTPPAKVTGLSSAARTGTTESVSWTGADGATTYLITWGTNTAGNNAGNMTTTETATVIEGLTHSTKYYWFVNAVTLCTGEPSSVSSFTTLHQTAPTNCNLTNIAMTSVKVNWTDNSTTESGYYVERSTDGTTYAQIGTTDRNIKTYIGAGANDLTVNTRYWFRVRALDDGGFTDYATAPAKYTLANTPTFDSISDVTSSVTKMSWLANSNPAGTEYYCENVTAKTNSGWITAQNWASTDLSPSTLYTYWIKARNGDLVETTSIKLSEQETASVAKFALIKADRNTLLNGDIIRGKPDMEIRAESTKDILIATFKIKIDDVQVSDGTNGTYDTLSGSGKTVTFYYIPKTALSVGEHKMEFQVYDSAGTILYEERNPVSVKSEIGVSGAVLSYPNPGDPAKGPIRISYNLNTDTGVVMYLFDTSGRLVWKHDYPSGSQGGTAGYNEVVWDGNDIGGIILPNDVYLLRAVDQGSGRVIGKCKIVILRSSAAKFDINSLAGIIGLTLFGLIGIGGLLRLRRMTKPGDKTNKTGRNIKTHLL